MPGDKRKRLSSWTYKKVGEAVNSQLARLEYNTISDRIPSPSNSTTQNEFHATRLEDSSDVSSEESSRSDSDSSLGAAEAEIETTDDSSFSDSSLGAAEVDEELAKENSLAEDIQKWAISHSIAQNAISSLLAIFQKHKIGDLPKDARTLLKTPRVVNTLSVSGGQYIYFGVRKGIENILSKIQFSKSSLNINVIANIDGLPVAKSSSSQVWPILIKVNILGHSFIFAAAIFHGQQKPKSLDFLNPFVEEMKELAVNGFCFNKTQIIVSLNSIVCDAPARSFITCTKGHSGYFGCPKCVTEGDHLGRMCFPETDANIRSDASFRGRFQAEHHLGYSPLEEIPGFDMVQQLPLDYMHLVCLGVVRKLLNLWLKGNLSYRLPGRDVEKISASLAALKASIPREFARKPRALKELDRWKATEFRQFLLYTGPVVLKEVLKPEFYAHFAILHCAVTILSSEKLCISQNLYARDLLVCFVKTFSELYGSHLISYNVHCLIHLPADVLKYGDLSTFSAFEFENFLNKLKKKLRKPEKTLQQLSNRLNEEMLSDNYIKIEKVKNMSFGKEYSGGALLEGCSGPQYKSIKLREFILSVDQPDNCCFLTDGTIIIIHNICHKNSDVVVVGKAFLVKDTLYSLPCPSTFLEIYRVHSLSKLNCWSVNLIKKKCVNFEFEGKNIIFPMLHSSN